MLFDKFRRTDTGVKKCKIFLIRDMEAEFNTTTLKPNQNFKEVLTYSIDRYDSFL